MTKTIVLALLTACGVSGPTAPEDEPIQTPDVDKPSEDQHFCCKSVSTDGKVGHGEGCALAEKVHIAACSTVLYCPGGYTLDNGAVTCPL